MSNILFKGGPVLIPMIIGSIIGLGICLERLHIFRLVNKFDMVKFTQVIFRYLRAGKFEEALEVCENNIWHPIAAIFKEGILKNNLPADRLEKVIEQEGNSQISRLEKYLGTLVTIVTIEPMMGFLGTITGLIKAFMSWEKAGADITVSALAAGIYQAMVTTAAGLTIAIPLYVFYNYFTNRIRYFGNEFTNLSIGLMDALEDSKTKKTFSETYENIK